MTAARKMTSNLLYETSETPKQKTDYAVFVSYWTLLDFFHHVLITNRFISVERSSVLGSGEDDSIVSVGLCVCYTN